MPAKHPKFDYLKVIPDKKGRLRYYFRRKVGGKMRYWPLPDDPGSAEFHRRYAEVLATFEVQPPVVLDGTVASLIAMYKASSAFTSLRPKTQAYYAEHLDDLAVIGADRIEDIRKIHILALAEQYSAHPRLRHRFARVTSRLFGFAEERDLIRHNPAAKNQTRRQTQTIRCVDGSTVREL
jgi:hypothetical protein